MEPVTRSGDGRFPPPPIFKRVKTPDTRTNAVTRLISSLLPLELNQGTAKSVRIRKVPPNPKGIIQCYRLTDYLEIAVWYSATRMVMMGPTKPGP